MDVVAATCPTTFSSPARSNLRNLKRRLRRPQTEPNERRPLKYVVTTGWLISEKEYGSTGLEKVIICMSAFFVTNCFPGRHRFSQTTTDFDGQRWLSFDFLTLSTCFVALIFLMQGRPPSKKYQTDSWLAGSCRPMLAAYPILPYCDSYSQSHSSKISRNCRLTRGMIHLGESAMGTSPATLGHLVSLFGIDVEDISTTTKWRQSCEDQTRKDRPSSGAGFTLLAMYDRIEWTSAIKLHFRGIRASLIIRTRFNVFNVSYSAVWVLRRRENSTTVNCARDAMMCLQNQGCLPFAQLLSLNAKVDMLVPKIKFTC